MKKSLSLAISALTAGLVLGSPALFAATTGPTLYGKINVSLDQLDHEGAARFIAEKKKGDFDQDKKLAIDQWELNSNASRLGVKGDFGLEGSDLSIIYQAEYGIDVDDGNTAFTARNIFIGLQGDFGRVTAGKFDTPLKLIEGKFDQFNDSKADLDTIVGGHNRVNNIVQYSSPKFGDYFTANVAFIIPEGADVDGDGKREKGLTDSFSASLVADTGIYYGAIAVSGNEAASRSVDGLIRADIIRAVGTAKLGAFEAGILLQQAKDAASGSHLQDDTILLSAAWNIEKFKLKAQYGYSEGKQTKEEATLAAIGVDYALAAKTRVYSLLGSLALDKADLRDNTFSFGIEHAF